MTFKIPERLRREVNRLQTLIRFFAILLAARVVVTLAPLALESDLSGNVSVTGLIALLDRYLEPIFLAILLLMDPKKADERSAVNTQQYSS